MAIIDYRVDDGIAILTWDDADRPMNVLSGDAPKDPDEIEEIMRAA